VAGILNSLTRRRKAPPPLDELGGRADGALAILDVDGTVLHLSSPRVTTALRYFLARIELQGSGLPGSVAVTAALHGEGVTYITRTLAALIAYDSDATVALVDLNWRRPVGPVEVEEGPVGEERQEPERRPTLVDAVDQGVPVDEILRPTSNPRLHLVDAGEMALARRPALGSSRALQVVIEKLVGRFDQVLLDLPPVLASADAIALAQLADAYAFVVRQGTTTNTQVETALEELRGTPGLGVILNRAESNVPLRLRKLLGA
jgi:Mrp family chromosome partitioning ATPase